MAQQSSNYLFKLAKKVFIKGEKADGVFEYLNEVDSLLQKKCSAQNYKHFLSLSNVEEALKVNLSYKLKSIMKKRASMKASKKDFNNSLYALDIVKVSQSHVKYVAFVLFKNGISDGSIKCPINLQNLTNLCILNGLYQLSLDSASCYEAGYFNNTQQFSEFITDAMKEINRLIRPHAVSIIESVGITDTILPTAIGNSYGDIYEQHLEWAKNSRLNQTKGGDAIPDGYMEYIMPILKAKL